VTEALRPLGYVGAIAGLTLFPIAFAGAYFQIFIATPEEPFCSVFRVNYIETWYVVSAYALTSLGPRWSPRGALAEPCRLPRPHRPRRLSRADTKPLRT
jgi:hypothetical protein